MNVLIATCNDSIANLLEEEIEWRSKFFENDFQA